MTADPQTVGPKMSVVDLERAFIERHVSGFPVAEGDRLLGVVSRSDVVRSLSVEHTHEEQISDYYRDHPGYRPVLDGESDAAAMAARVGKRIDALTVADVMVKSALTAGPEQGLEDVASLLLSHGIHRLPVIEDGRLVGIVTTLDLVGLIADRRYVEAEIS